jgi:hypothetical protein
MLEFADQLNAQLSGGSEDYRASAHRNTTIANESGFDVEDQGGRRPGDPAGKPGESFDGIVESVMK